MKAKIKKLINELALWVVVICTGIVFCFVAYILIPATYNYLNKPKSHYALCAEVESKKIIDLTTLDTKILEGCTSGAR